MFGTMTKEDVGFLIGDLVLCNAEDPTISEKIGEVLDRVEELVQDKEAAWKLVHDIEDAFLSLSHNYVVAAFFCGVALAKDPLSLFEPVELARLKARLLKRREERAASQEQEAHEEAA